MVNTDEIMNIRISPDYFRRCARNDYSSPVPWVWIREAIQNSTDAGASEINIRIDDEYVELTDNGCGMTSDIILNKLLTLGGTHKESENATGGFGKAKEILFFCWDFWSIETRPSKSEKLYLDRDMIGKEAIRHESGEFNRGTTIRIKYDPSEHSRWNWQENIKEFIASCTLKARVFLNGYVLEQLQNRGTKIEYENFTMRINKSKKTELMYVRVNGVTMFYDWVFTQIAATVTIELKGKSVDMLSANRDSVRSSLMSEFKGIYKTILTNPKTIENQVNADKIHIDKYTVRELERKWEEIKITHSPAPSTVQFVEAAISACVSGDKPLTESVIQDIQDIDPEVAETLRTVIKGEYTSMMGYPFIVQRYKDKTPSIDPATPKAHQILHMWKLIVDEIVRENNLNVGSYKVGFDFDPENKGSNLTYSDPRDGKTRCVLLNPTKVKQYSDAIGLGHSLYHIATHEVAHFLYADHDENFSIMWGKLMEGMGNNHKKWNKLFLKAKSEAAVLTKQARAA